MKIALVDDEHYYLDEMERLCLDFGKRCHLHIETVLFDSGEAFGDAFSCHAFEYITKPFSPQRISQVLEDALKVLPTLYRYMEVYSGQKTVRIFLTISSSL